MGLGLRIRIGNLDSRFELGIRNGDWDWELRLGIGIGDWNWGLGLEILGLGWGGIGDLVVTFG